MKLNTIIILFFNCFVTFAQPGENWKIVFEDEFEGSNLDTTKWSYNYTWGNTHNHMAYVDKKQVTVKDSKLHITAIDKRHPDAPDGTGKWSHQFGYLKFDYTSGAIHSNGKFNLTYGYIEGRFKMSGTGTWPAFWMLNKSGKWPPEIDILEVPHERTIHHYYFHHGPDASREASFGGKHQGVDKSIGFHTYGVEWGPDFMKFYFDGEKVSEHLNRKECAEGEEMYMIINLAVGGWAGEPKPKDVFPATYECDWVKVWKKKNNKIP